MEEHRKRKRTILMSIAVSRFGDRVEPIQIDFANRLGTTPQTVSSWVNAKTEPGRMSRASLRNLNPTLWDMLMTEVKAIQNGTDKVYDEHVRKYGKPGVHV